MSIKFIQFDNSVNSTIYPRQTNVNIARIRVVEILYVFYSLFRGRI